MTTDLQRQHDLVITCAVLTAVSTVIVSLRIIVRGYFIRKMGWDDWAIIGALVLTIGYFAEIVVAKYNNIGFPMDTLTLDNMINLIKTTLAIQVTYYTIILFVKASILFMYLRFAVTRTLKVLCIGTIILHIIFFIICIATTLAQCNPLHKMWDLTGTVEGTCINTTAFFYFTSGFNIITDIWIILLPIKTLYKINRPRNEKIALLGIFGVGVFACIVSIIRLHSIYTYTLAQDPFKNALKVNLWSMIEVNIAILCASVPGLKPLFTPSQLLEATRKTNQGGSSYQYQSNERSGYMRSTKSTDSQTSQTEIVYGIETMSDGRDGTAIGVPPSAAMANSNSAIHVQHSISVERKKDDSSSTENILIERPGQ